MATPKAAVYQRQDEGTCQKVQEFGCGITEFRLHLLKLIQNRTKILHRETVSGELFGLLSQLMELDELKELVLVGGTNLALRYGHRASGDIELFGPQPIEHLDISTVLHPIGKVCYLGGNSARQVYSADQVKVDFISYQYPWLESPELIEGIAYASGPDLAALNIEAIHHRRSRKDFIDLYLLLQLFSLEEILNFYERKIGDGSKFLALKSLTYFADAENEAMPKMFLQVTWPQIKTAIDHATKKLL